jgi:VIT1/CCC1 family predicted Fe2+/Mn2+ transporter
MSFRLGRRRALREDTSAREAAAGGGEPWTAQMRAEGAQDGYGERAAAGSGVAAAGTRREPERERVPRERRGRRGRAREAGAAGVGAAGSAVLGLARLVMLVAGLIALLIALAIVLVVVDANASNSIVKGIHEGANFFAGAFTNLITFSGHHPNRAIIVDWGIAVLVFLIVGAVISRLIASIGMRGVSFERRHRALPTH